MKKQGIRPFSETFSMLCDGDADVRVAHELAELVKAVDATGKSGKLTISIGVLRDIKTVRLSVETRVTMPREAMEMTEFFIDAEGGVHRQDPRQSDLWDPPRKLAAFPGGDD